MKIVSIVGARPQFVKAATVSRALARTASIREVIVHTGQHYDNNMSGVFFDELGIPQPSYNLGIGSAGQGAQTGRMLEAIENVLLEERPDWLLVYGDTNSTIAGALAAAKLHIAVAHVEAGLRSFNRRMPEEVNRVVTDHLSDLLFAPTSTAVKNLAGEGIDAGKVAMVGDVMYDTALYFRDRAQSQSQIRHELGLREGAYVLATIHRAENTDDPARLSAILGGIAEVSQERTVVLPVHPRTRNAIRNAGLQLPDTLRFIDPVSYLDMVMLECGAELIVTDSGGVQKEAYFFRVPCLTLRDETEWVELVQCGWNTLLTPTTGAAVADGIRTALRAGRPDQWLDSLYGDGAAAEAIVASLLARAPAIVS